MAQDVIGVVQQEVNDCYTKISNYSIEDMSISANAHRLHNYLKSKPDGWVIRRNQLTLSK